MHESPSSSGDSSVLQEALEHLHELLGIGLSLTDVSGKVLAATECQSVCARFHRVSPASGGNCVETRRMLEEGLQKDGRVLRQCRNRMWELGTAVEVGGKRVGHLFFGQFFLEGEVPDVAFFARQTAAYGFEPDAYLGALDTVPRLNHRQVDELVAFSSRLAVLLARFATGPSAARLGAAELRAMFDAAPVGVMRLLPEGGLGYVNAAGARLFGYATEGAMLASVSRTSHLFANSDECADVLHRAASIHGEVAREVMLRRSDGACFAGIFRARVLRNERGEVSGLDAYVVDVSDRRRREAERYRQAVDEARLRGLATRVNEIELVLGMDGSIVEANDRASGAYGYSRDELLKLNFASLQPGLGHRQGAELTAQATTPEGTRFEAEHRRRDGARFPVEVSSRSFEVGGRTYLHTLIRDLTGQRKAERDTRMLAGLVSTLRDALVLVDDELRITGWLGASQAIYGYEPDEALGRKLPELLFEEYDDAEDRAAHHQRLKENGRTRSTVRHRRKSGEWLDVDLAFETVRDGSGRATGYFALGRDVTQERAASRRLERSEERLRLALAASRRVEWELDLVQGTAVLGPEWLAVTGRAPEEVSDPRTWTDLIHPDDRRKAVEPMVLCMEGAATSYEAEFRISQPDGSWRTFLAQGHVTRSEAGHTEKIVGTIGDITELRALLGRAARAERVASLSTLAAGMAHEMNNPLAVVVANLGWAADEVTANRAQGDDAWRQDVREALVEASDEAKRVGNIVGRLRLFAGKGVFTTSGRALLGLALDEALRLVAGELSRCTSVESEVPVDARLAMSDLALVQLLANLLKNAGQATGARPNRVRVSARVARAGHLAISISDTGEGMDSQTLTHAFDPFFTTRSQGREMGLGLPVCLGIVQAVGGDLHLESTVGIGTTVTALLPLELTGPKAS